MSSPKPPASAPIPTTFLLNRKRASPTLSEPDSLITPPASITSSIASRYSQIHNQNDGGTRLPATDFQIQVDFKRGLWGFCGSNEQNVGRCWMPGICYDEDQCRDGCGNLDRKDLGTAQCSSKDSSGNDIRASLCATAFLTLDNDLGPFQYIACGWTTTRAHYTASQVDAAQNPLEPSTSSSFSSSSSSAISSSLSTLPSQTTTTLPTPTATSTNPAGTTATNSNGSSSSNSNIGAIVGGVIGGLAIICAFIFAAWFVWAYRVRDRRKQQAQSQPLNGNGYGGNTDGSRRSSTSDDGNTPSLGQTSNHVPLSYSPDGQVQQAYGSVPAASAPGSGYGQGQAGYGMPFVSMSEMQQQRTMVKDTEGGWGPRELDGAHGGPGFFVHDQGYGSHAPQEVASIEKATELPVEMEVAELSSGWEDTHGSDGHGNGFEGPGRGGGRR